MSKSPLNLRCGTVWRCVTLFLCLLAGGVSRTHAEEPSADKPITWVAWSDGMFAQAKREHKFVLLDLEAVWCHWCHVMDTTTYADPDVRKMMNARYIAVKVDQDSRPDISNRYEDYGWPATVVFDADGKEIVKRQGYLGLRWRLSGRLRTRRVAAFPLLCWRGSAKFTRRSTT